MLDVYLHRPSLLVVAFLSFLRLDILFLQP